MAGQDAMEQQLAERIQQYPSAELPMTLQIAEGLLQRAKTEPEAVADKLRVRAQAHLSPAAIVQPAAAASESEQSPTGRAEILAGLRSLHASLNQAPQDAPAKSLSHLEQQMLAQNARLLGIEQAPEQPVEQEAPGLRSAKRFRHSRQRQEKRKVVEVALQRRPEDPGPLNPEMLAVTVLSELQSVSPAYLERYVSFVEGLVVLASSSKN